MFKRHTETSSALTGFVATTLRAAAVLEKHLVAPRSVLGMDFLSIVAVVTDEVDDENGGKEERRMQQHAF